MKYDLDTRKLIGDDGKQVFFYTIYEGEYLGNHRTFISYRRSMYELEPDGTLRLIILTGKEWLAVRKLHKTDKGVSNDSYGLREGNCACDIYIDNRYDGSVWDEEEARKVEKDEGAVCRWRYVG